MSTKFLSFNTFYLEKTLWQRITIIMQLLLYMHVYILM